MTFCHRNTYGSVLVFAQRERSIYVNMADVGTPMEVACVEGPLAGQLLPVLVCCFTASHVSRTDFSENEDQNCNKTLDTSLHRHSLSVGAFSIFGDV